MLWPITETTLEWLSDDSEEQARLGGQYNLESKRLSYVHYGRIRHSMLVFFPVYVEKSRYSRPRLEGDGATLTRIETNLNLYCVPDHA